jgi:hypothetical protein
MKRILLSLSSQSAIARNGLKTLFPVKSCTEGDKVHKDRQMSQTSSSATPYHGNTGSETDTMSSNFTNQTLDSVGQEEDNLLTTLPGPSISRSTTESIVQGNIFDVWTDGMSDEQFWGLLAQLDSSVHSNPI